MAWLNVNRPRRSQFRSRRARPTGLIVIHTAESVMDSLGPDTGAEGVARFIRDRTNPGSYHDLADSDSLINLVDYENEAYQDGTGSNPYALSISFACRTTDWRKMSAARRAAFLAQGAKAFVRQQAWLKSKGYPATPLHRVSKMASSAGAAGFIASQVALILLDQGHEVIGIDVMNDGARAGDTGSTGRPPARA
mgnify:CR=1 FL=1